VGGYSVAGYDPSTLSFTNSGTVRRTVWVVVDQGLGLSQSSYAPATGFTLDWRKQ
jgi:hypothetical protein